MALYQRPRPYKYLHEDDSWYYGTTTTNYIQTNNTTWGNGTTITSYPSYNPPPAREKTQAEKDMAWLKEEVDAICKGAYA